jgi:hypothetical protein
MNIIKDTREKNGFDFISSDHNIISLKLDAGDYTVECISDKIAIERKASVAEIYGNLIKTKMRERFEREMEILQGLPEAYIVCEFPESNLYEFPHNCGFPPKVKKYIRASGSYLRKLIHNITNDYGIPFIFCNDKAEAETVTLNLLEQAHVKYKQ